MKIRFDLNSHSNRKEEVNSPLKQTRSLSNPASLVNLRRRIIELFSFFCQIRARQTIIRRLLTFTCNTQKIRTVGRAKGPGSKSACKGALRKKHLASQRHNFITIYYVLPCNRPRQNRSNDQLASLEFRGKRSLSLSLSLFLSLSLGPYNRIKPRGCMEYPTTGTRSVFPGIRSDVRSAYRVYSPCLWGIGDSKFRRVRLSNELTIGFDRESEQGQCTLKSCSVGKHYFSHLSMIKLGSVFMILFFFARDFKF